MAYRIEYTREALLDLRWLAERRGKRHAATIVDAVADYLTDEPGRHSTKRREMEANPLGASWHLRLGPLRVYYDIDDANQTVWVLRAGIKERNRVTIRGEDLDLRDLAEEATGSEQGDG